MLGAGWPDVPQWAKLTILSVCEAPARFSHPMQAKNVAGAHLKHRALLCDRAAKSFKRRQTVGLALLVLVAVMLNKCHAMSRHVTPHVEGLRRKREWACEACMSIACPAVLHFCPATPSASSSSECSTYETLADTDVLDRFYNNLKRLLAAIPKEPLLFRVDNNNRSKTECDFSKYDSPMRMLPDACF